jgi:hypothetical protein
METTDIMQLYLKLFQIYMKEIFLVFKVNELMNKVRKINETYLYNQEEFHFIQHLTNLYDKMILIIDYSKTIQINILQLDNNNIFFYDIITFVYLEDLVQQIECKFSYFQEILLNLGYFLM